MTVPPSTSASPSPDQEAGEEDSSDDDAPATGSKAIAADKLAPLVPKTPFFYGWVILPIATMAMIATSPGQTFGVSAFNASFVESLKISQTQLATAYMLGTLVACLPQGFFGAWIDRRGNRQAMGFAALLLGAACIVTSFSNAYTIFLSFVLLRMFGQGLLSLTASNSLGMWFDRKLGTASALMTLGAAAGVAIVPTVSLSLIETVGWRVAYSILGVGVWVTVLPLIFFHRNRPEDIGQRVDGDSHTGSSDLNLRDEWTLGEAAGTRAYWLMMLMSVLWSMVGTAIMFHIQPLLTEHGVAKAAQAQFYTTFAISLGVMQFCGGLLADRTPIHRLYATSMSLSTIAIVWLVFVDSPLDATFFAILFGAGQGLFFVVGQTAWPRYFGRLHLGKIRGSMWTVAVASSSAGPLVSALALDVLGGYTPSLWLFASLFALMSVGALFAVRPTKEK